MAVTEGYQSQQFQDSNYSMFLVSEVACLGSETRLLDCPIHRRYPAVNCDRSGIEDAGVRCTNKCVHIYYAYQNINGNLVLNCIIM